MKIALALAVTLSMLLAPACTPRPASTEDAASKPQATEDIVPVDGVKPTSPGLAPGGEPPPPSGGEQGTDKAPPMSPEDCEKVGTVVGDPGDGRTRSPDFVCPNGKKPIGLVSLGIEGSVCCPL